MTTTFDIYPSHVLVNGVWHSYEEAVKAYPIIAKYLKR